MKVHEANQGLTLPGSVVAIGAFDGVHQGHQAVLRQAVERSRQLGVESVAYTIDPPPRCRFQGSRMLTTLQEKLDRFAVLGLNHAVVAHFDERYAARRVDAFIRELTALNPREVIVGQDFRFGRNREGDVALLRRHFPVRIVQTVCCADGQRISSTRIRELIERGEWEQSTVLLGWPLSS
ncbi:FAD synthetase [Geobacillus thermodenitrificans]|jgi:riboflavin kinase / FMN adenylyltransferase|uniref:Putative bifunctional riboflavin kinase/FMN adenylyltransferase n=1 Tax=Geobacillus thermodenitrificans (strain NG80-2) TaxID=420246 RepID=RIBF_GEOTN|nr:FAD synthetase [Geobacillus thermodenitrificans]A4IT50.1 RecName: Full=Putative bifunctional riboflavin kinase/FMN adenylyltransferase; AltName: Full=Putative riboflavin biosynthesis protein RibF; Includes: RecName: Full=Riboflavin kinase; AltName: Full=Flavokinase; Includes: RecName: Full=FMN adenylyltransferase; AltName: Full=FAD pyrophosphorylase; AltName: Full=FAD synthase [Geobacillus thermodenitrificans NG80-2]ABO68504.1 Riboflavin kinase/FMN adenylyltransferase [Geobacillus thermodenitr